LYSSTRAVSNVGALATLVFLFRAELAVALDMGSAFFE
jgi:hypothetical protein